MDKDLFSVLVSGALVVFLACSLLYGIGKIANKNGIYSLDDFRAKIAARF